MIKFLLVIFSISFSEIAADIAVVPASGGTDLSVTSPNVDDGWAVLGDIIIAEGETDDISAGQTDDSLVLSAPFNWQFLPGEGSVFAIGDLDDTNIPPLSITVTSTEITITFSTRDEGDSGTNEFDVITVSGIKVTPVLPNIVPSSGQIKRTGGNGVIMGGGVADDLNYGDLSLDIVNPLPVELSLFTASVKNKSVHLKWETVTEVNNYGFEVERSSDKKNWEKIAFVQGNGSSNSPKNYFYIDSKVKLNGKYFYRLKQLDSDGVFTYSKIIEVETALLSGFRLSQNYPNPFNPETKITFAFNEDGKAEMKVFDLLGNELAIIFDDAVEAGRVYEVIFNASNISSGIYLYQLTGNDKTETKKMTVIK